MPIQTDVDEIAEVFQRSQRKASRSRVNPFMRFITEEVPSDPEDGEPIRKVRLGRVAMLIALGLLLPLAFATQQPNRKVQTAVQDPPRQRRTAKIPQEQVAVAPMPSAPPTLPPSAAMPSPRIYNQTSLPTQRFANPPRIPRFSPQGSTTKASESLGSLISSRAQNKPLYDFTGNSDAAAQQTQTLNATLSQQRRPPRIPSGTKIQARIADGVNGQGNDTPVLAQVSAPLTKDGEVLIPSGSTLVGNVKEVGPSRISLNFSVLVFPDGTEKKLEGAVALQEGTLGVAAQVSGGRGSNPAGAFTANLFSEAGQELNRPTSSFSSNGAGYATGSVQNAPIEQRLLGVGLSSLGRTMTQSAAAQRQQTNNEPITYRSSPTDIVVVLVHGLDL